MTWFRAVLVVILIAIVAVVIDRYYLLPDHGVEVMVTGLSELSSHRITGDNADYDEMSKNSPMEYFVQVMTLDQQRNFTVQIDNDSFYRALRVGDSCIGIETTPGNIETLLKR